MTPIGKILTNVDSLKDVTSGDVISLYLGWLVDPVSWKSTGSFYCSSFEQTN
jgi:hypothetical protein